jgi:hypothetical protein
LTEGPARRDFGADVKKFTKRALWLKFNALKASYLCLAVGLLTALFGFLKK